MTTVAEHAVDLVRSRLGDFEDQSRALEADWTPPDLHQLRIRGKKLRYTLEIVVEVLPAMKEPLTRLVRLQEVLGDLQDAEVGMAHLREIPAASASARSAHAFLRERYAVDRRSALEAWQTEFPAEVRRTLVADIRSAARPK